MRYTEQMEESTLNRRSKLSFLASKGEAEDMNLTHAI